MYNTINQVIVALRNYGIYYENRYGTSLQMEEKEVILVDILKIVCFLSLPTDILNKEKNPMQSIERNLRADFVYSIDDASKFVKIDAYSVRDINAEIRKRAWFAFQYMFLLFDKEVEERNEFLWITLLLPYVYKVNIFSGTNRAQNKVNRDMLMKLLGEYPFEKNQDRITNLFPKFKEKIGKNSDYIKDMLSHCENLGMVINESFLNNTLEGCQQGLAVAIQFSKRKGMRE